jgi:flagellar motility protein MotE (MotC chaperone)
MLMVSGALLLGADEPASVGSVPSPSTGAAALDALELEGQRQALEMLQRDVESKLEALEELRKQAEASLKVQKKAHTEDLEKLVKFYQAMKPQNAARLLEELPLNLAAEVLSAMKVREAGKIMNSIKTQRAVQISRRMAGNRR